MKLLHIADLHLDRSFEGIPQMTSGLRSALLRAPKIVLTRIIDTALEEAVDGVLFVGDTFHQSRISIQTQQFFLDELRRLEEAGIPVFLTFGNHDYYLKERFWFAWPANVHLFTSETPAVCEFETRAHEKVMVAGFSYTHRWLEKNVAAEFPRRKAGIDYALGMYHGELNDAARKYAPFSLQTLKEKEYDCWALGHIHQRAVLSQKPLILYPGTPMGRSRKETGEKSISLLEFTPQGVSARAIVVAPWRYQDFSISLGTAQQLEEVFPLISETLAPQFAAPQKTLALLQLTALEKLPRQFFTEYESGELLSYLQEELWQKSGETCWVVELADPPAMQEKIPLPLSESQLAELLSEYASPDFLNDFPELANKTLFTDWLESEEFQLEALSRVKKYMTQISVFEEGSNAADQL